MVALEARLGQELYREERKAVQRGGSILASAERLTAIQARLGWMLRRDERQAILRGEHVLPSAVQGETWMAHPAEHTSGKSKVFQGATIDSSRRKH